MRFSTASESNTLSNKFQRLGSGFKVQGSEVDTLSNSEVGMRNAEYGKNITAEAQSMQRKIYFFPFAAARQF